MKLTVLCDDQTKHIYDVVIEQDENKVYVAYVSKLPGCHTEGDSISEVMTNIKEAAELYLGNIAGC
jgi:predicted RNase H-like HicB family nuclease